MTIRQKLIVVGNGMVGQKFLEKFTAAGGHEHFEILVFGEEPRAAYNRVYLSSYFSGKSADDLQLVPLHWYQEHSVELRSNEKVLSIDSLKKCVHSSHGKSYSYDKLILATGSKAFIPPAAGFNAPGIFAYRTIEDLENITHFAQGKKTVAVIGGGLLGLEAAKAMLDLDLKTHVVEFATRLMPRQLDEKGGLFLKNKIEQLGVEVHFSKNTKEVKQDVDGLTLHFTDTTELSVDMIVISAGIQPQDELAASINLERGKRGGFVVNKYMETSIPNIYAIGECALVGGMIYGLVAPGYRMAEAVAKNLLGGSETFVGADLSTKLKLMGIDVASFGDALGETANSREVVLEKSLEGIYKKLVLNQQGTALLGGILVGDASEYQKLLQTYQLGLTLPKAPESLLVPQSESASTSDSLSIAFLPSSAVICSCENVTKGDLGKAITEHQITTITELKSQTKAGTGCGGCLPLMTDILNLELEKQGVKINHSLCEHFSFTRQELYTLIRNEKLLTFEEILAKHGQGKGCEICKPILASLLASCWNRPILEQSHIQDTNDAFLANIQKNGTYSVVPRIPAGEIKPEQLIAIGEVAKEFNLYTKITGSQRIDLFGARLEELPKIWQKLIDVGLESGHAYGKSLRMVKSCVGTSWCRYGVDDSTSFAIELENRYKGIRAPHKLKGAVSGCTRECAEAASKDFGVIATEDGWNLYIGGNGGIRPQHAVLLAANLDKETLVRYLDRYLMYYIRTAEKLTRTSTWLNKLEGGIEHVKQVVIEDSLGIAEELEEQMLSNVALYECEWKNTLQDPEKLKRFHPFVNSMEPDPSIHFTEKRGQIQPA